MAIPRVSTCCCGCSLETGCKIIGCVEAVTLIIVIIISSVTAGLLEDYHNFPELSQGQVDFIYGVLVTLIIVSSIQLILTGMMLWGVIKMKAYMMRPWLFFAGITILITFFSLISNCIIAASSHNGGIISTLISNALDIFLKCYYFLVVYSHYKNLSETPVPNFHGGV